MSIAAALGMDDWKDLNKIDFNTRFYGKMTGKMLFKKGTVIKIPPTLVSVLGQTYLE